jgi:glycosyltransferase involved in cell wall biosynthesis
VSQPVRIVVVAPWAHRLGGAEQMLGTLAATVDRSRIQIAHVTFLEDGPFRTELEAEGIPTSALAVRRLRDLGDYTRSVRELAGVLRAEQPELVLSWMAKAHLYAAPAARLAGLRSRCVWWQHMVPDGHWLDRLATLLPSEAVGASSEASAAAQLNMRPHRRTFTVRPGIPSPAQASSRDAARARLGFSDGTFVAAIVGRLQPWKGQHVLLHAVAQLRARGADVAALVVGGEAYGLSPGYAHSLESLADELGIGEHTRFTGQVEDVSDALAAADACVNASDGEPFGIVLLEAMAASLPVVAVAKAGPLEIVESGVTGLLIPHADAGELAAALCKLAADPASARGMGIAGRARYERLFTDTRMAADFAEQLERLSGRGERRAVTIVVQHVGPVGGMERQLTEIITGLLAFGWSVTVIARACELPPHENLHWIPIRGPYRPFVIGYPWFLLRAGLALRRHRNGIVHLNGALAPNRADIATIHFSHRGFARSAPPREGSSSGRLYWLNARVGSWMSRLGERWCYRRSRIPRLIAISSGVGEEARRMYGYEPAEIAVIPYGVDAARFARRAQARERMREQLLGERDQLIVLFVGGDWGRKGLDCVISALPHAPDWHAVVVGGGDVAQYSALAERLGVAERVTFAGHQSDPADIYSAADAFCLPTSYETFCLVAHEAAAAGLPLLVPPVHGVDVLIEDGVNGWFISRDADDIARRLRTLAEDPEGRAAMGAAARQASLRYPWSGAVASHIALYEEVLRGRSAEPSHDHPAAPWAERV